MPDNAPLAAPKPQSGSAEWEAQHEARRVPTGDFAELDAAVGGPYGKGNIKLNDRPVYVWPGNKGDYSSLESMSFSADGKEILIPKVVDGRLLSDEEAVKHAMRTKQHLGIFDTPEEATKYAIDLERRQQSYYENGPGIGILQRHFGANGARSR